jgi:hypothetical protein
MIAQAPVGPQRKGIGVRSGLQRESAHTQDVGFAQDRSKQILEMQVRSGQNQVPVKDDLAALPN